MVQSALREQMAAAEQVQSANERATRARVPIKSLQFVERLRARAERTRTRPVDARQLDAKLRHLEEQLAGVAELLASVRKEQIDTRTAREAQM